LCAIGDSSSDFLRRRLAKSIGSAGVVVEEQYRLLR